MKKENNVKSRHLTIALWSIVSIALIHAPVLAQSGPTGQDPEITADGTVASPNTPEKPDPNSDEIEKSQTNDDQLGFNKTDRQHLQKAAESHSQGLLAISVLSAIAIIVIVGQMSRYLDSNNLVSQIKTLEKSLASHTEAVKDAHQNPSAAYGPLLSRIQPPVGAEGSEVAITGNRFDAGARVFFGGEAATRERVLDAQTIKCYVPPRENARVDAQDLVDVRVENSDGSHHRRTKNFRYVPKLEITGPDLEPETSGGTATLQIPGFREETSVSLTGAPLTRHALGRVRNEVRIDYGPREESASELVITVENPDDGQTASKAYPYPSS